MCDITINDISVCSTAKFFNDGTNMASKFSAEFDITKNSFSDPAGFKII